MKALNKSGITIGIFASSSPVNGFKNDKTYDFLKSKGFNVFEHRQVRMSYEGYMAGDIQERVNALHELFLNKDIDIIMSYWGGQNSNQILPYLDFNLIKNNYKPIIGFSDTTALLLAITKITGKITYLGPAAITFTKPEPIGYSWESFNKLVIDGENFSVDDSPEYADDLYFLNKDKTKRIIKKNEGRKILIEGVAEGEIVAGNLQTMLALTGTEFFPDLSKKILFLEEAEEVSYPMIDRFLTQLTQIIDINKLSGICFGKFCSQSGFKDDTDVQKFLGRIFSGVKIPIIYNLNFGHTDPVFTIPNGGHCLIDTKNNIIKLSVCD